VLVWRHEAKAARRRRSTEIHPALVSERLASVQAEITQVVTLAGPVPDADDARPIHILPVRYVQREEERS
jgi:hypothetical protein